MSCIVDMDAPAWLFLLRRKKPTIRLTPNVSSSAMESDCVEDEERWSTVDATLSFLYTTAMFTIPSLTPS